MFSILDGREYLYQWDLDRKLLVKDRNVNQVHFSNTVINNALVCKAFEDNGLWVVNVPNVLLQDSLDVTVYAFGDNHTKYQKVVEVKSKNKPDDYVYTETEILNWYDLKERIEAIEDADCSVEVDQSYTPESDNPQSGKAVAEALETVKVKSNANIHAEYFTITASGEVALKPEYRGASTGATAFPNSVSDMGVFEGSLIDILPEDLVIPEEVDEIAVSTLTKGMFLDNKRIVSITLPSTIIDIPEQCFNQAVNLAHIYNTENIITVGEKAFRFTRVEEARFPNLQAFTGALTFSNNPYLTYCDMGNATEVPKQTFKHCMGLRAVVGENISVVGQEAFCNTVRLKSINFVDKITSIGKFGFWLSNYNNWDGLKITPTASSYATAEAVNPTGNNYWTNTKPTVCNNPTPSALCQRDERWIDSAYGTKSNVAPMTYADGCLQLCNLHVYSGIMEKKYNTVFEFEEDIKKVESVVIDDTTYTGAELLAIQNGTFAKAIILLKGIGLTGVKRYRTYSEEILKELYQTLADGGYAILYVKSSASGGHAVVAHGITENGEFMILDSERRYPYNNSKPARYNLPFSKTILRGFEEDVIIIPKLKEVTE